MKGCQWFLEPRSANANRIFAQGCPDTKEADADECNDGKPHNVWECTWGYLQSLKNSNWMGLSRRTEFRIWNRQSANAKIRDCTTLKMFDEKKKKTRAGVARKSQIA